MSKMCFCQQSVLKFSAESAKNICEGVYFLVNLHPLCLRTLYIYIEINSFSDTYLKLQGFLTFLEIAGQRLVKHLLL